MELLFATASGNVLTPRHGWRRRPATWCSGLAHDLGTRRRPRTRRTTTWGPNGATRARRASFGAETASNFLVAGARPVHRRPRAVRRRPRARSAGRWSASASEDPPGMSAEPPDRTHRQACWCSWQPSCSSTSCTPSATFLHARRADPYGAGPMEPRCAEVEPEAAAPPEACGASFLVGRFVFFYSYVKDPKSRSLGFALSMLPVMVLVIGTVAGAARGLLQAHGN